jgi:DNA replication protein DnaC
MSHNLKQILAQPKPTALYNESLPSSYRLKLMLEKSGMPLRHMLACDDKELGEHSQWLAALNAMNEAIDGGWIVALLGKRGTGKTQMAVRSGVGQIILADKSVRYLKLADLFRQLRDAMGSRASEQATIHRYATPWLLILDEAHERTGSDFEDRTLTDLIDKRYDRMLPTVFVSNQKPDAFQKSVGVSIVSRMQEAGTVIECTWESFRTGAKQ